MAGTSPLVVNTMVVGLLVESLIYGAFFLAAGATAFSFFRRTHKYTPQYGAQIFYPIVLFLVFVMASIHEAITVFCTMDHVIAAEPGVLLLTAQTGLYVTQVVLLLILIIYRAFTHFTRLKIFALPLTILAIIAGTAGYRAAYDLYGSSFGLNLALDPTTHSNLAYTRPTLGDYETWMMGFTAGAVVVSTIGNLFICIAICRARYSLGLTTGRAILSFVLESGIMVTIILGVMLPVNLFLSTGTAFLVESIAVPSMALTATGVMFIFAIDGSFDSVHDAEGEQPLTKSATSSSPSRPRSPLIPTARSPTDLEKGTPAPTSPFDSKSDSGPWRAQLQDALNTVPPIAMVQARQMRSAHKATDGQLSHARSSSRSGGRRSPTKPVSPPPPSRLRNVVSADDVKEESTRPDTQRITAFGNASAKPTNTAESYLPSME